uniref:Uncharacterized protein n=1 Tax=Arundo donax TaxID=35708 RepID=A0A0A9FZ67_ARUDO
MSNTSKRKILTETELFI